MNGWILSLLALGLWLYGLYLALTRTKSLTAKGVAVAGLAGLAFAFWGPNFEVRVGLTPDAGFAYTLEKEEALPQLEEIEIAATNALVVVRPGPGRLRVSYQARIERALARMHPDLAVEEGKLRFWDDRQPKGTLYRIELALPEPVAARVSVTNGELKAEDRLKSLVFSATNGKVDLEDYRPTGATVINATNGKVVLSGFAPEGPTRIDLTNGDVEVRAERPLRIKARVTNGSVHLPGKSLGGAGGVEVTYGPEQAPLLSVHILNGKLQYLEESP